MGFMMTNYDSFTVIFLSMPSYSFSLVSINSEDFLYRKCVQLRVCKLQI